MNSEERFKRIMERRRDESTKGAGLDEEFSDFVSDLPLEHPLHVQESWNGGEDRLQFWDWANWLRAAFAGVCAALAVLVVFPLPLVESTVDRLEEMGGECDFVKDVAIW